MDAKSKINTTKKSLKLPQGRKLKMPTREQFERANHARTESFQTSSAEEKVISLLSDDRQRICPIVTYVLSGINIFVSLFLYFKYGGFKLSNEAFLSLGADYYPLTFQAGEYWRTISSAFLNCSFVQLGLNIACLITFGRLLEKIIGHLRTGIIYVFAAFTGSVFSSLFNTNQISCGSSAAVFGFFGAIIGYLLMTYKSYNMTVKDVIGYLKGSLLFAVMNIVVSLLFGWMSLHMGGFVGGLLLGVLIGMWREQWYPFGIAAILVAAYIAFARLPNAESQMIWESSNYADVTLEDSLNVLNEWREINEGQNITRISRAKKLDELRGRVVRVRGRVCDVSDSFLLVAQLMGSPDNVCVFLEVEGIARCANLSAFAKGANLVVVFDERHVERAKELQKGTEVEVCATMYNRTLNAVYDEMIAAGIFGAPLLTDGLIMVE